MTFHGMFPSTGGASISIGEYTGDGEVTQAVEHGFNVAPKLIIILYNMAGDSQPNFSGFMLPEVTMSLAGIASNNAIDVDRKYFYPFMDAPNVMLNPAGYTFSWIAFR